ncbi:OmpA family protein [Gelidibacter japonicus]|uniref:OmpA family protein n=1 Tax=Gelidibacter japonicus TaxID=1962232 RepID=UPI002021E72A|nr:OmpA family protein [Gelidibacter japonicus]MCL8008979.1 OmpA family protein [Gelidibacter japonicus]
MKCFLPLKTIFGLAFIGLFMTPTANAQIWKKIQKSAERTVERKLERKTEKETGKMMDSILDPSQKPPSAESPSNESDHSVNNQSTSSDSNSQTTKTANKKNLSDDLEVYSKYDFVPGDKVLFYDDFSQDFIGDFPSKWNTNGSGEVVKLNNMDGNWFELITGNSIFYIPDVKNLPEDYTIEFDIVTQGFSQKTSSSSYLQITLTDSDALRKYSDNYIQSSLSLCQYNTYGIHSTNIFNNKSGGIDSKVAADIREALLNQPHIAIAVTRNRYRLWVNETKYLDIPRMVTELNVLKHLKFNVIGLKEGEERIFISNLKVADGGEDLRRKLLSEGKISTNGILFDSGSANIKPQSLGIVFQVSQVLLQDENMKLTIVGHTDADGNSDANMTLSKQRAESVKNALVNLYNISPDRLQTDGKGASTPVADNTTPDGKAQNRRVEFIKI